MDEPAIEVEGLAKRFGSTRVLEDVTFKVPCGQTFAFLGRNGAGKTTTILMLLGLLRASAGRVRVLGLDPRRQAMEIRRRVGYVAEEQVMFGWMRVSQILSFIAPFYPKWDPDYAQELAQRFELPMKHRVNHLSKGQNRRLALLLALAHRPELVILDDPTLGLDPIMRKEFLRDIVEHLQGRGVTVFFSSHLLYEIEPVADVVAILDRGVIVKQSATEQLREEAKQLVMSLEDYNKVGGFPGTLDVKRDGNRVAVVVENADAALTVARAASVKPQVSGLNLDEIFEAYVIGRTDGQVGPKPTVERVA